MIKSTRVLGYGNPGRQDDGLGPLFIDLLEALKAGQLAAVDTQSNYQLTVEDAHDLQFYEQVIFVDAAINGPEPFSFTPVFASDKHGIGSHDLSPEALLQLCATLYQHVPNAWILAIRGYNFDAFEEKPGRKALENCQTALHFLVDWLNRD
jgi:hydrogenase maturation protease